MKSNFLKENQLKPLSNKDTFRFSCKHCGQCCLNRVDESSVILYPYDIFNLAKGLKRTTKSVITHHTDIVVGSNSKLPLAVLKNTETAFGSRCIFKEGNSCSVNDFKPGACSLFPLGRATTTGVRPESQVEYFIQEVQCKGSIKTPNDMHTLDDWIVNRQESEDALLAYGAFIEKLGSSQYTNIIEDGKLSDTFKSKLLSALTQSLYSNYETDQDFLLQFEENSNQWLHLQTEFDNMYFKLKSNTLDDITTQDNNIKNNTAYNWR